MKTDQELWERQQELLNLYLEVNHELLKIPGVRSIGVGIKETGGKLTEDLCFRVYVKEKKRENDLPHEQIVPPTIKGVKTDVLSTFSGERICNEGRIRPLVGGIEITKIEDFVPIPGTLGCMATLEDEKPVILTAAHVIEGSLEGGERVWQPEPKTFLGFTCNEIGFTENRKAGNVEFDGQTFFLDCGIATIDKNVDFSNRMRNVPKLSATTTVPTEIAGTAQAVAGTQVRKVGAKSGLTIGRILEVNHDFEDIDPAGDILIRPNQIIIRPTLEYVDPVSNAVIPFDGYPKDGEDKLFADNGDSGSVLLNDANEVVGLVWFKTAAGNALACHIQPVLKEMSITINKTMSSLAMPDAEASLLGGSSGIIPSEVSFSRSTGHLISANQTVGSNTNQSVLEEIRRNYDEALLLINHRRPVLVAWRRVQGPAFMAVLFEASKDPYSQLPREVNGVPLQLLLRTMLAVLEKHGSEGLSQAIHEHSPLLLHAFDKARNFDDLINRLKTQSELVE